MSEPTLPPPLVTLEQMGAFLRAPTYATVDPEMTMLGEALGAALEYVESQVGSLVGASRQYSVYPHRHNLVLRDTHLQEITTVTDPDGNVVVPESTNLLAGIVVLPCVPMDARPWTVTATSRATRTSVALAVKIIASHLFEINRGKGRGSSSTSYPSSDDAAPLLGFAIPARAAELLAPYVRTGR